MAFMKMVGFDVTPRISSRAIMPASVPSSNRLRWMLSYQMDWPSWASFWVVFITVSFSERRRWL
jgi:hypothetical protein